jgi:WD40 repeat protein
MYSPEFVLVQVASGNVLAKIPNRGAPIVGLAVSEDERLLATGHTDGRVRIYRLAPRAMWEQFDSDAVVADAPLIESVACQVLVTNAQLASSLQFWGNDRLVVAGGGPEGPLQVWKIEPRYGWQKTPTPLDECGEACVAPRAERCFLRGDDLTLFVGDWPALAEVRPLEASLRDGNNLAISPDGKRGAFARHRTVVEVWDLDLFRPLQVLPQMADMALAVAFSPCGRQVLATNKVEGVMCWSMDDWSLVRRLPPEGTVKRLGFDPTGRLLWLSGSVNEAVYTQLLEWPSTAPLARWAEPSEVSAIAWSADGEWLARARSNGTIGLRRLSTNESHELVGHTGGIGGVAFHPDGTTLYSIGGDALRLWHVPTGKPLGVVEAPPNVKVDQLLFTPDGQTLRTCVSEAGGDGGIWELPLPELAW